MLILALASESQGPFCSRSRTNIPAVTVVIGFDASVWGGGAAIWLVRYGSSLDRLESVRPDAFMAETWTDADAALIGAEIGNTASQALWEGYAAVMAVFAWWPIIEAARGHVILRGDAQGVLDGFTVFRCKDPKLNKMAMELALMFGPIGRSLESVHLWSEQNTLCDALSRIAQGVRVPRIVSGCPRSARATRPFLLLSAS